MQNLEVFIQIIYVMLLTFNNAKVFVYKKFLLPRHER